MSREQEINDALAVIKDALESGEIEGRFGENGPWVTPRWREIVIGDKDLEYRAKREPREFWVVWHGSGDAPDDHNNTRWFEIPRFKREVMENNWDNVIKVREVIE